MEQKTIWLLYSFFFKKICYGHDTFSFFSFLSSVLSFSFLDASGFIYRAYYAFPKIINTKGQPLGALLGFVTMMLKYNDGHKKSHWACVFDKPGKQDYWRVAHFPDYKKKRPSMPGDLVEQLPLIYEACKLMNLPIVEQDGQEADDLMASLGKKALEHNELSEVVLVSSDKDLHQLVSPRCKQYDPLKQRFFYLQDIREKWGVEPWQIPHIQCLAGDPSDGIPGIPSVGMKTATMWIQKYNTYEGVLANIVELDKKKANMLMEYQNQGHICYTLALLRQDLEIPPLETFLCKEISWKDLGDFLHNLELHQLSRRCYKESI